MVMSKDLTQIYSTKGEKTMKKIVSMALVCVLLLGSMLALASCGNISESYAEKVNKAAEAGEHYTLEKVKEDLGDEAIDITVAGTGAVIAVKGCASLDELEDKLDNGEKLQGIVVTFVLGKATKAIYKEISENDF